MLESFFRRQNKAGLLTIKDQLILDDRQRQQIVNCIVDFMIEAFGKGDVSNITDHHKQSTATVAVALFVGLKSNDPAKPLVTKFKINYFINSEYKIFVEQIDWRRWFFS